MSNSGHFFIRADDWGKQFLAHAWSMFSFSPGHTAQHGMAAVPSVAKINEKIKIEMKNENEK